MDNTKLGFTNGSNNEETTDTSSVEEFTQNDMENLQQVLQMMSGFCIAHGGDTPKSFMHYFIELSMAMTIYIKEHAPDGFMENHQLHFSILHDFIKDLEQVGTHTISTLFSKVQALQSIEMPRSTKGLAQ